MVRYLLIFKLQIMYHSTEMFAVILLQKYLQIRSKLIVNPFISYQDWRLFLYSIVRQFKKIWMWKISHKNILSISVWMELFFQKRGTKKSRNVVQVFCLQSCPSFVNKRLIFTYILFTHYYSVKKIFCYIF